MSPAEAGKGPAVMQPVPPLVRRAPVWLHRDRMIQRVIVMAEEAGLSPAQLCQQLGPFSYDSLFQKPACFQSAYGWDLIQFLGESIRPEPEEKSLAGGNGQTAVPTDVRATFFQLVSQRRHEAEQKAEQLKHDRWQELKELAAIADREMDGRSRAAKAKRRGA